MKTIEIKLYKFAELSDDAQQRAIEKLWDINVDYEWWEFTFQDAKNIGLVINGFDIDRPSYCKGEFKTSGLECARAVIAEHGEYCDTYQTAKAFLTAYDKLVEKYSDGIKLDIVAEDNECDFDDEADELESDLLSDMLDNYRIILSKECEYLTSKESIIDTINANDYDFTEEGDLY